MRTAYIQNFLKYKYLLKELIQRDIKIKYRRSFLGMMWSVLNPLGMMIVMTIVFSNVFRSDIKNFPVYLMCGQLIFNFFSEATTVAMGSVLGNAALIKKVYIPKYLFPVSKVCSSFVNLLTSFIALMIVIVATGTPITFHILLFWMPILYVFIFSTGMGLILSALVVTFRDLEHLYSILITVWLYMTPIFYPMSMLPDWVRTIVGLNPITNMVEMLREAILYNAIPGPMMHLKCIVSCIIAMGLGLWIFIKQQDSFILKV